MVTMQRPEIVLPTQIEEWLRNAPRDRLTGSITIHYLDGDMRSWERKETGRRER